MRHGVVLVLGLGLASVIGCKHENLAATIPVVDEFTVPPDDPRYNTPPMAEYRKPATKKEWGSKPGMAGSAMGSGPQLGQ